MNAANELVGVADCVLLLVRHNKSKSTISEKVKSEETESLVELLGSVLSDPQNRKSFGLWLS